MDKTVTDKTGAPLASGEQAAGSRTSNPLAVPRAGTGEQGGSREWTGHPVDIRLTIPLPFRSFYITIVAGPERRSKVRRVSERKKHPLLTVGNLLVYMVIGGVCGLAVLGTIQLLLAHALISGSLWATALSGLLFVAGISVCFWLVVWQPITAARRAKRASGAAESAR